MKTKESDLDIRDHLLAAIMKLNKEIQKYEKSKEDKKKI